MNKELEKIKEVINDVSGAFGFKVKKLILFGSRARGESGRYSDYDILVVLDTDLDIKTKIEISAEIGKQLAEFYIDADLIIKSEGEVVRYKEEIGTVTREALKEGLVI